MVNKNYSLQFSKIWKTKSINSKKIFNKLSSHWRSISIFKKKDTAQYFVIINQKEDACNFEYSLIHQSK